MNTVNSFQFQSVQGPADGDRRHSLTEGYQPVSRIGEVVINSFVDAYEFAALDASISHQKLTGEDPTTGAYDPSGMSGAAPGDQIAEMKPHFHLWATALPGMIAVSRKARNSCFRNYVAAETATPTLVSCACQPKDAENQFYFAGIVRSKSVRALDDGVGPSQDEYFTLAIGGMATILNNSKSAVFPGDYLEWTFFSEANAQDVKNAGGTSLSRGTGRQAPRRVGIRVASSTSSRVIGRALTFAKSNETFDLLIKAA